jgi:glutamate-1-semialdehyde 2,1-aminomutase
MPTSPARTVVLTTLGVIIGGNGLMAFSTAMQDADIDEIIETLDRALKRLAHSPT